MLPDFPEIKKELEEKASVFMYIKSVIEDPIMSQVNRITQHEGEEFSFATTDGDIKRMTYKRFESPIEISKDDPMNLNVQQISGRLEQATRDIRRQSTQMVMAHISEAAMEAGTAHHAGGPITHDKILETLESMDICFDENGQPTFSIYAHPRLMPQFKKLNDEIERNPELQARFDDVLNRKREVWNAEEASRQLVD